MSRRKECKNKYCEEFPYAGEYCETHNKEVIEKRKRKENANNLLSTGLVDGTQITNPALIKEYYELSKYFSDASFAFQSGKSYGFIALEDADAALSWCKSLSEIIYYNELSHRGHDDQNHTDHLRDNFWGRLQESQNKIH